MTREVALEVPAYGTRARIALLWDDAPRTCATIWQALPIAKPAFHGRRSGQELFMLADALGNPGRENPTRRVSAGDVLFAHLPPTWPDEHPEYTRSDAGLYDIVFIYGPDALVRGPDEIVEANLFGRVHAADAGDLAAACTRMWLEGAEDVRLVRAGPE